MFAFTLVTVPFFAYAGIFSILSGFFSGGGEGTSEMQENSQTLALLQAAANTDPVSSARGGGDISIVDNSALLPETGPSGSLADVESGTTHNGKISVYIVRKGDTLSQIAKMFGVTTNTIIWGNDIKGGLIHEGQTLTILPVSGVQHTVKKGDTVKSIAKLYKADADEIVQYNDLDENTALTVGSVIVVPDGELEIIPSVRSTGRTSPLRGAGGPDYGDYYLRPIVGGVRTQGLHGYNGVDLAAYRGAPILASATGDVIVAKSGGWNGGYGNYVVLNHDNGTQTLYAHLSSLIVSVGQSVVRGQVIGFEGSTGKATGPHLHFEIRGAKNPF